MNKQDKEHISIQPPKAKKEEKLLILHNDTRVDSYFWLNDRNNPDVISYLEEENTYTEKILGHTSEFQKQLFEELKGWIKEEDESVPYLSNQYYYYHRYETGQEHPIYYRKRESIDAIEELLLNVNLLAKEYAYFQVGGLFVSENNETLAYGEDFVSRRLYTLKFKDLTTGVMLPDEIPNTSGSVAWANDNKTIFYALKDVETLRSYKILKHVLGTSVNEDQVVFEETDDTFFSGVYKSKSSEYIMIYSYSTLSTEFQYLKAADPIGLFKVIQTRMKDLEYEPAHFKDKFFIKTNADQATNFKLVVTSVEQTSKENWVDVIPHRDTVLLESLTIFQDYLVLNERINGITEIRVLPWADFNKGYYVSWDEKAHTVSPGANEEFKTNILRLMYTSMTTPQSVIDFNMETKQKEIKKEKVVLGNFKKEDYVSEWVFIKARDGQNIPMSIVYKKGFKKERKHPFLLYAYGSYGHSVDPGFSTNRLSLLNRGFGFAIAHIRGGEELGRSWYENGKLLKKKNTFNDFVDCGQWLIDYKYVALDQLFAMGGSAGGLLMGVIANQKSNMWKGIIAAVPFVDIITTMLDDSIPLTTFEYDEWGNPNDEKYYFYIKSYSPYDNVEAKDYPNMLITTGLHDSQVQYWEPAKWTAKLREMKTDNNLLLLKTNMKAGHGGASGRFEPLKEIALEYVFMFDLVGIDN